MFLERQAAVKKLHDVMDDLHTSGSLVLLSGEAGIGKTTLLEHVHRELSLHADVMWTGCDPLFTPRPYAPFYDFAQSGFPKLHNALENNANAHVIFTCLYNELGNLTKPTLIIIEDVHWADHASLDLLKYIARRISFLPCVLLLSYRDDEITPQHPLNSLLTLLPAAHTHRVELMHLSLKAVTQLAKNSHHDPKVLYQTTGGNPFFVNELLGAPNLSQTIPLSICDSVNSRVKRLQPEERKIMEVLSVIPYSIPLILIQSLFNKDAEVHALTCVSKKLLHVDHHDEFRFRHELVRLAILESVPSPYKRRFHALILEKLETVKNDISVDRLVYHAEGALDTERILRYAPAAALHAAQQGAHREAASFYKKALAYVEYANSELAASLHEGWAYETGLTTHIDQDVIDARRHAITLWRALKRQDKVGENLRNLSRLYWYQGQADKAEQYANQAILTYESMPPSKDLAMAYSMRSQLDMLNDRMSDAITWGYKALELARQFHSPVVEAHALNNIGTAQVMRGNSDGEALLLSSLTIAKAHDLHEDAARVYTNFSDYCVRFKRLDKAETLTNEGIQYDIAHDLDAWTYYLIGLQAQLRLEQGRFVDAETIAAGVYQLDSQTLLMKLPALIVLSRVQSRMGKSESLRLLNQALTDAESTAEYQYIVPASLGLIEFYWLTQHNHERAVDLIHRLAALPKGLLNAWQLGELVTWARRFEVNPTNVCTEAIAKPYQLAIKHQYQQAFEQWQKLKMPYNAALSLIPLGSANYSHSQVNQHLTTASKLFIEMGAKAAFLKLKESVQKFNVGCHLPTLPRGPYSKSRQHPLGLTNKEQQVLKLLITGASNQHIALELSRSNRTIENHVSSILAKFCVENRIEVMLKVQNEPWLAE